MLSLKKLYLWALFFNAFQLPHFQIHESCIYINYDAHAAHRESYLTWGFILSSQCYPHNATLKFIMIFNMRAGSEYLLCQLPNTPDSCLFPYHRGECSCDPKSPEIRVFVPVKQEGPLLQVWRIVGEFSNGQKVTKNFTLRVKAAAASPALTEEFGHVLLMAVGCVGFLVLIAIILFAMVLSMLGRAQGKARRRPRGDYCRGEEEVKTSEGPPAPGGRDPEECTSISDGASWLTDFDSCYDFASDQTSHYDKAGSILSLSTGSSEITDDQPQCPDLASTQDDVHSIAKPKPLPCRVAKKAVPLRAKPAPFSYLLSNPFSKPRPWSRSCQAEIPGDTDLKASVIKKRVPLPNRYANGAAEAKDFPKTERNQSATYIHPTASESEKSTKGFPKTDCGPSMYIHSTAPKSAKSNGEFPKTECSLPTLYIHPIASESEKSRKDTEALVSTRL